MADTPKSIKANVFIDGTQGSATLRTLKNDASRLANELSNLKRGTAEWNEKLRQVQQAKRYIKEAEKDIQGVGSAFKNVTQQIERYGIAGAIYFAAGIVKNAIGSLIGKTNELSDSLADVRKTTGLTEDGVNRLYDKISQINTRKSQKELLELAVAAGKLGIEGVNNIAKFVEEANIIDVALGEDLGKDAITQIGKLSTIYGDALLNIASGINQIGASSAASESFQVDFLNRMSGVAPTAKLATGEVLGYGAALENLGQTQEVSATALNKFFVDFVRDTEKFGTTVGFAKGELSALVNDKGTNAGFIEFLKRLKSSSSSSQDLLKKLQQLDVDGTRGANVLLTLANNIGLVEAQQKIATDAIKQGTSVLNEYYIKNNNAAAITEKLGKYFAKWFVNTDTLNFFTKLVRGVADFIGVISSADVAMLKFAEQNKKVSQLDGTLVPLLDKYDALKSKTTLTKDEQIELKDTINKISEIVPTAISEFDKYGNALEINAGKARKFTEQQKDILKITNKAAIEENKDLLRAEYLNNQKLISQLKTGYTFITDNQGLFTKKVEYTNDELIEIQKNIAESQQRMIGLRGIIKQLSGEDFNPAKGKSKAKVVTVESDGGMSDDEKKKRLKEIDDFKKEYQAALNWGNIHDKTGLEKKLEEINQKFDPIIAKAKKLKKTVEEQALIGLKKANQDVVIKADFANRTDDEFKENKQYVEEYFAEKNKILADQYENESITKADFQAQQYDLEVAYLTALQLLYGDYGKSKVSLEKKLTDASIRETTRLIKEKKKNFDTEISIAKEGASILSSLASLQEGKDRASIETKRNLALAEIAINTGIAISQAVKIGTTGDPYTAPLRIAATIGAVLAGIAQAKSAIDSSDAAIESLDKEAKDKAEKDAKDSERNSKKSQTDQGQSVKINAFADGGYTSSGFVTRPTIFTQSASGKPFLAGEAGTEYVISNSMLKMPGVANFVGILESMRKEKRAFAIGGPTDSTIKFPDSINSTVDLQPLVDAFGALASIMQESNKKPIVFNYSKFEDFQAEIKAVRTSAGA